MNLSDVLWRGVGIPLLVSVIVLLAAARPWRPVSQLCRLRRAAGPLAVSLGYMAAHLALINWSWPGLPPADTLHWSLFTAPVALAVALVEILHRPRPLVRWGMRTLLLAGLLGLLIIRHWNSSSPGSSVAWMGALFSGFGLWWWAMDAATRQLRPPKFVASLLVIVSAMSVVLAVSGTGLLAQLIGAVAAAAGPLLVLSIWRREIPAGIAALPVIALLLPLLWGNAVLFTYAELKLATALVLLAPLVLVATAALPPVRRMRQSARLPVRWAGELLPVAVAGVPLAIAVSQAVSSSPEMVF